MTRVRCRGLVLLGAIAICLSALEIAIEDVSNALAVNPLVSQPR